MNPHLHQMPLVEAGELLGLWLVGLCAAYIAWRIAAAACSGLYGLYVRATEEEPGWPTRSGWAAPYDRESDR